MTVRKATAFDPAGGCVGPLDLIAELREQPALADARLAKDRRDAALAGLRHGEESRQPFPLRVASDHRGVDATQAAAGRALPQACDLVCLHRVRLSLEIEGPDVNRIADRRYAAMRRATYKDGAR